MDKNDINQIKKLIEQDFEKGAWWDLRVRALRLADSLEHVVDFLTIVDAVSKPVKADDHAVDDE